MALKPSPKLLSWFSLVPVSCAVYPPPPEESPLPLSLAVLLGDTNEVLREKYGPSESLPDSLGRDTHGGQVWVQ